MADELRIEAISPATREPALLYLARSPYENVFLGHLILHGMETPVGGKISVALDKRGVVGVTYSGSQLVLAADPPALQPFAEDAKRHRGERMIVGPREMVRTFWDLIASWHNRPRIVRDRQLVMAIDRSSLRAPAAGTPTVTVRHARVDECSAVTESSAAMIRQELAYDPRRGSSDFATRVRQMIERKLWWVGVAGGRLCLFCHTGPWCERTVQLQGIWTPPHLRGRGLATASLAAICDRLLDLWPTLSLYVNDFNDAAIALYRRVGFERVGDFQTILF